MSSLDPNKTHTQDIPDVMGPTADMLAVVALILSVIYADSNYDAWDVVLSSVVIWMCARRLYRHPREPLNTAPRVLARVGIALVITVWIRIGIEVLWHFKVLTPHQPSPLQNIIVHKEVFDVACAALIFGLLHGIDWHFHRKRTS